MKKEKISIALAIIGLIADVITISVFAFRTNAMNSEQFIIPYGITFLIMAYSYFVAVWYFSVKKFKSKENIEEEKFLESVLNYTVAIGLVLLPIHVVSASYMGEFGGGILAVFAQVVIGVGVYWAVVILISEIYSEQD